MIGATTPVTGGDYASNRAAWDGLSAHLHQQFEQELSEAAAALDNAACVQTTAAMRVGVDRPAAPSVDEVDDVSAAALPAGCRAGPRGTTECDTLFGFGAGSTPFTVTGQVTYAGTPVCVTYGHGQLCNGWFGAWGADGTTATGATGGGIGASTLAVASVGNVRAQVTSSPSALYFAKAPSGSSTSVTITPYVTLLDLTLQSAPDSTQCAPTKIAYGVVTPNVSTPSAFSQLLVSCVPEVAFDGRRDAAAQSSSTVQSLLAAQQGVVSESGASHAVLELVGAATSIHDTMAATSHTGLFTAGAGAVGSGRVLSAACPVLNAALASGTRARDALACTQSSIPPWHGTVLGQSVVSPQLTATAAAVSSAGIGEIHLLMAFDTVEVHECWPAALCS